MAFCDVNCISFCCAYRPGCFYRSHEVWMFSFFCIEIVHSKTLPVKTTMSKTFNYCISFCCFCILHPFKLKTFRLIWKYILLRKKNVLKTRHIYLYESTVVQRTSVFVHILCFSWPTWNEHDHCFKRGRLIFSHAISSTHVASFTAGMDSHAARQEELSSAAGT